MQIIIDGKKLKTGEAKTVLEVALANDIWIPTLCHHESLSDYGACRLCLVEVIRRGKSKVTASCTLPVKEGLEIVTDSDRIIRLRRLVMELILASCPHSETVIEMAERLGARNNRLEPDPDGDCIRCGLCVRACAELSGAQAINFAHRGVNRTITTPFDAPNPVCVLCGACVFVCPTGSRLLDLARISGETPQKLLSRFDAGLAPRAAVHLPLRQSLPNVPVIDRNACLHLNREGCGICEQVCEAEAICFDDEDRDEEIEVGAVITAPGSDEFLPYEKHEFGYGRFPNVISSIQFERVLSASGPFQGHVVRPSDHREPKKVAFLQCVGSRDISTGNEYCSAVCCMYAIKEAVIAKEHLKTIEPVIFFMDMRAYGKDFDRYYEKAQTGHGIRFIRSRVSGIEKAPASDNLILTYASEDGRVLKEEFDLVVLSVGLEARQKHRILAQRLGLRLNDFGFIDTKFFLPQQTSRPGVLVGGSASGPKDIPETVAQASGAAADAAELLSERRGSEVMPEFYPPERDIRGEATRIGVFICNCGINIGGVVDVPEVVEYARSLPGVAFIEENLFTCSQDTQKRIKEVIEQHKLNRVVVASCSPRTHEPLFQETLREAGLNPGLFEMANIRDQCSWTHMFQPAEATLKAKDLVRMSVAKAGLLEPLEKISLDVIQKAVVIGGGLSGMTAALSLARQGFEVSLVEKEKELGGNLKKLYFTIEGENIQEYLASLIDEVKRHPLLKVHQESTIEEIEGYIGNYNLRLKVKGRKSPLNLEAGVIIVTTGGEESKPDEYLYKKDKRVITQLELEKRLANPQSAIRNLQSVVMIQCVGSRDDEHPYCSRLCCTEAIKNALKLKEVNPEAEIYILFRDIRTYGFFELYYRKAREKGIIFLRYDKDDKPRVKKAGKKLRVEVKDLILERELKIHPDLVVLAPAIVPGEDAGRIARMLKVPLNEDGFFLEAHVKLRPVDFATEGVFLAGLAHSPKMIGESISQAKAAAARAATILSKEKIEMEGKVARVKEERCTGCGLCAEVCPFQAIEMDEERQVAVINEALCKGCGACTASCRPSAIDLKGFRDEQILAILNTI